MYQSLSSELCNTVADPPPPSWQVRSKEVEDYTEQNGEIYQPFWSKNSCWLQRTF